MCSTRQRDKGYQVPGTRQLALYYTPLISRNVIVIVIVIVVAIAIAVCFLFNLPITGRLAG